MPIALSAQPRAALATVARQYIKHVKPPYDGWRWRAVRQPVPRSMHSLLLLCMHWTLTWRLRLQAKSAGFAWSLTLCTAAAAATTGATGLLGDCCPAAMQCRAAPHVTGTVAVYLEAHPDATPAEVHDALVNAATPGLLKSPLMLDGTPNRLLYSQDWGSAAATMDLPSVVATTGNQ